MLSIPVMRKASANAPAVQTLLAGVMRQTLKVIDVRRLEMLRRRDIQTDQSTSDVLQHVLGMRLPEAQQVRHLSWGGGLTSAQVNLVALHAYGAVRIAEELERPPQGNF